jgi:DNA-binding LacI/PurR family transcriptional regulator
MTIRDVARRAGVSLQTVSNVLNGHHARTSAETRHRVLRTVKELGYHPNAHARGLRLERSDTVGYFTVDPSPQFLADAGRSGLLSGVADVLREQDYCFLVQALPADAPGETFRRLYRQRRFDGAVIEVPDRCRAQLLRVGCPCVLVEGQAKGRNLACVRADNRGGAEEVVHYLRAKGHDRIDVLTLAATWPNMEERLEGYQAAMKALRLPKPRKLTAAVETVASAKAAMAAALRRHPRLSALICINDTLALGAVQAARALGRRVPQDVAIVGFGDFTFAQYVEPPLTTVVLPKYEMGRRAAEQLLSCLREGGFGEVDVVFPAQLVPRGSA